MLFRKNTRGRAFRSAIAAFATVSLTIVISLSGCSQEPVFADIEKEVKLVDPSMRGTVVSLARVGNDLYTTNGNVYIRTDGNGAWSTLSLPDGAYRCAELASDGTYLYGRFTTEDYSKFHSVQRYDREARKWDAVAGIDDCILIGSGANRIYGFTGSYENADLQVTQGAGSLEFGTVIAEGLDGPDVNTTFGNYVATTTSVYSCDGTALTDIVADSTLPENVTDITDAKAITVVPATGNLYVVTTGYIWRFDGAEWTCSSHSLSQPTSIAWLGLDKNILLVSNGREGETKGGYIELPLGDDGTLGTTTAKPGKSDRSSISTDAREQYVSSLGEKAVYNIFAVTGTVPSGNDYVLYASVVDPVYDGLWAYYSGTRKEWNRD
jgi:hypothetical protein